MRQIQYLINVKKTILIALLAILSISVKAQVIDTIGIIKNKALNYTYHELLKPNTYKSIVWGQLSHYKDEYSLLNIFTAKNKGNQTVKLCYNFHFDTNLNLLWVNTDPIEKQLKVLKFEIEQLNSQKRMINETRDREIEMIKDSTN